MPQDVTLTVVSTPDGAAVRFKSAASVVKTRFLKVWVTFEKKKQPLI